MKVIKGCDLLCPAVGMAITLAMLPSFCLPAGSLIQKSPQSSPARVLAGSPLVDAHTHLETDDLEHSVQAALQAMPGENATKIFFLPPPFTEDDSARYDAQAILPHIRGHEAQLAVLGGGGILNSMIQQAVRSGDAGPAVRQRFKQQAEELLRAGAAGFGEMAVEHFQGATVYQSTPPDHPLFLLLADVAAAHHVPIDLHMEAVPEDMRLPEDLRSPPNPRRLHRNIAAFERLLRHNPRAQIIWAHAGSDFTGYRTPDLCRRLLAAHSNLYMEIKIDPARPGRNSPLSDGGNGTIKPEWLHLFEKFPDRFIVGSDQHYPEPPGTMQRWQALVILLNQLPEELRQKIAAKNALRLYSGGSVQSK